MTDRLRTSIVNKSRAAKVRAERAYEESGKMLPQEHRARVVAAFAYAHLQLTFVATAEMMKAEGHDTSVHRHLGTSFYIQLGNRRAIVATDSINDGRLRISLEGSTVSILDSAPPVTLVPGELHEWSCEIADGVVDFLLGSR